MENIFKNVLLDGEVIEYSAKASTKPYIMKRIIAPLILLIVATSVLTLLAILLPYHYVGKGWHGSEYYWHDYVGVPFYVPIIVFCVLGIINIVIYNISKKGANNYAIAVTNDRVLVKSGAIKPDFHAYPFIDVLGVAIITHNRSLFDDKEMENCSLVINIPAKVSLHLFTPSLVNGFDFAKKIEQSAKERIIEGQNVSIY